jgi:hypothetical protein
VIFTRSDGVQVDMSTGEVVGQTEPTQVTAAQARYPETGTEIYSGGAGRTAMEALQQLSWNANAALFALPDSVIQAAGRAAGVREDEIPTFTKFFNRGQTAPKNVVERYTAAIGQGIGAGLPLIGALGAVAKTKALTGPLSPSAPVTKQIAKETLDFFRTNPKAAIAADLGFGAAYGATEQLVRETTEPGTTRDVLEATVPFAATVAAPLAVGKVIGTALKLSPTAMIARKAREQFDAMQGGVIPREDVAAAVEATTPNIPFFKGSMGFIGRTYGNYAAKDISKKIGDSLQLVGANPTQEQLKLTNDILKFAADNGFDGKFAFNLAESTLNPYLRQAYNDAISKSLTPELRKTILLKNEQRDEAFEALARSLTPESQLGLQEALVLNASERTKAIDDVLTKIKGLDEAEKLRITDAFNFESSLADIGNTLRSGILASREGLLSQFRTKVDDITRRPFGVRAATRVDGLPIEGIPSIPFQDFAMGFTNKYNLTPDNRWFGGEVPAPAKDIMRIMGRVKQQQDEALPKALSELVDKKLTEKNPLYRAESAENRKAMLDTAVNAILRGTPGMDTSVEKAMLKQAEDMAAKYADVQITLPEAADLLLSAQRFRTHMFLKSQTDKEFGLGSAFADQVDRFGKDVLKDVEDFIFRKDRFGKGFTEVPGIKDLEDAYYNTFTQGFDKLFPLMATKRRPTGEFVINDEALVKDLLSNRENLRSLNAIFGDNPTYARNLEKAMLMKARDSGVIGNDGVLNEAAYQRFLSRNQSLIDDLPASVQTALRDEVNLGQAFANERATLLAQKEALQDLELDKLVKQAIRPDAEVGDLVNKAVANPADMRKLVDAVGKDPDKLQAIKRGVWEQLVGKMLDVNDPVLLADFKRRYGKSLNILYSSPEEQRNLDMIAALQERILAVARPQGDRSPFRTFEEKLRETVGAGVGTLESTVRAATIRIISPVHAAVSLATRFLARQQQGLAERILLNALVDEKYAKEFIGASASIDTAKGFKQASKIAYDAGISLPFVFRMVPPGVKAANIEMAQALEDDSEALPLGIAPGPMSPAQGPRALPTMPPRPPVPPRLSPGQQYEQDLRRWQAPKPAAPAPARNLGQSPATRAVPQMPQGAGAPNYQMYQALFPNDPLNSLMQARQQPPQ